MAVVTLDETALLQAVHALAGRDADLAGVLQRYGPPPLWARPPGFATLVRVILEQQVSLASALAAFNRLQAAAGSLTPRAFLTFDDAALKQFGFSRQKTRYCRLLAEALESGVLDLAELAGLEDADARRRLTALKGIGPWSADIYLLMALRRADVWPPNDLALRSGLARLKGLPSPLSAADFEALGEAWRPWRSAAARLVWFDYLGGKP